MKINATVMNKVAMEDNALVNDMMSAITYEANNMSMTINSESICIQDRIIANKDGGCTEDEIAAARSKKEKLEAENDALRLENETLEPAHNAVVSSVIGASTELAINDVNAIRNILRICACTENKKFFRYAILAEGENFENFYNLFSQIHSTEMTVDENGRPVYYAPTWNVHKSVKSELEKLLKKMFFIPVENDYTGKISIKFNATDLYMLHECYVSGLDIKFVKDSKTKELKYTSAEFKTAITKSEGKNGTTYNGKKFMELIAKIAFNKIYAA